MVLKCQIGGLEVVRDAGVNEAVLRDLKFVYSLESVSTGREMVGVMRRFVKVEMVTNE